jgi:hypothetical protein
MKNKFYTQKIKLEFLGLQIDNHLNCKKHIEELIPKLSRACYAVRFMLRISNTDTL